jgi:MOSC domain-containing protein
VISITALSVTPVKGTRLRTVDAVELTKHGARGDRRFYVIDDRDRMVNGKIVGDLQSVVADVRDGALSLTFPDGRVVSAEVAPGALVRTRFFSRPREARLLEGPFSEALSEQFGKPLRLVEPATGAVDRGRSGGASLIAQASLARLADAAGEDSVDARRFRMLVEVDGLEAHAEDAWVGQRVQVGDAMVRFRGHVGRCLITSRDPETGIVDLPTLDILGEYRASLDTTERLPFGIYGEVIAEGTVRVGDPVKLLA